jgi:hypothetical protein
MYLLNSRDDEVPTSGDIFRYHQRTLFTSVFSNREMPQKPHSSRYVSLESAWIAAGEY